MWLNPHAYIKSASHGEKVVKTKFVYGTAQGLIDTLVELYLLQYLVESSTKEVLLALGLRPY